MAHEEVFSTETLIHSLRANAAEESDEEAAGIQIIIADRLADLTAALSDRDQRLAAWDDLWRSSCVVCGAEPGCDIDCPLCAWYAKHFSLRRLSDGN